MTAHAITIRAAEPGDEAMLTALIAASYDTLGGASYDPAHLAAAMPMMAKANPKLLASGTYFVAFAGDEPAACGGWTREKPGSGEIVEGVGHVRHFATHPDHLRKGLARMLLDRCVSEARLAGLRVLKSQSTLLAEPFYAAAGFRRMGAIEVEMGSGATLPAVAMEFDLAAQS